MPTGTPLPPPGAGEDKEVRVTVGWELPPDGLDHQRGEGQLPDAGIALGTGLEAATELPTGLVAHVHNLEDGNRPIEMDPPAAQAGQLAEAEASARKVRT